MKIKWLALLSYLFFFALGGFFVWLSVRHIDHEKWLLIKDAISRGRKWVILPVLSILLIAHYSRAVRWKLLMEPLGYHPSSYRVFLAVMVGYLVNSGAPRLGEIFKCSVLARTEKYKMDKLIGTILTEKAIDFVSMLIVFLLAVVLEGEVFGQYLKSLFEKIFQDKSGNISYTRFLITIGFILAGLITLYLILKKFGHFDIVAKIKGAIKNIMHGLLSIRNLQHKGLFIFHSIFIWFLYYLASYIGVLALKETQVLGLTGGLTTLAVGTVGMILTPNGIGAYPLLIAQLTGLYGLNADTTGNALGWIMWSAQYFILVAGGLVCFILVSRLSKTEISGLNDKLPVPD
jgi:glycosyltransferase 2 family protein